MDESEENMSAEDTQNVDSPGSVKIKPRKRSLVERELETNLTARVTSPVTSEGSNTSRYGRARRLKTTADADADQIMKPLKIDVSKQPQAYKMHASNSPISKESPKRTISVGSNIDDQIENIYNENMALSRFGSEEKAMLQSPAKKFSKVYIQKDLIQKPDTDTVVLIKNMFSPTKPNSHLNNILERSSEKYALNGHGKAWNGFLDTSSVVKTLDFDGKKKKKDEEKKKEKTVSKNELFDLEASCEYQVGDLAWARVGTYPFWPCIVIREPFCDMFVKKKLFGRVERFVIHVTFFGDNGRRGWIVDNMLRKYHGRAEFESSREKFTPEAKKKDPRFYAAHFVSEKKLPLWNVSVDEAETLMKEPKRLRIDILYDMLEKARASKTTPKREKGGKMSRTDSDVSLSESLYDTLFSEDDGTTDDSNRSKRVRNKSLDVSEVVTACLDNMAAKSGIIQIQRQSHMDRWLQKAKSKTPERIQPKLNVKVEREKRKDKMKKKSKEGKKTNKVRKNESLGSNANLLPYQNEHDYSSVNYENHNINDSFNKNTDSTSGNDSAFDSSGIGVVVKIENISSSMEDLSQDDIITTVVNDDIIMTDPENISNDDGHNEINHKDNINDTADNNNEHSLDNTKSNDDEQIATKEEVPVSNSDLTNTVQPRRSKRKRQTFDGLNNSITENKAKEPKLDLTEPTNINNTSIPDCKPEVYTTQENTTKGNKDSDSSENTEIEFNEPTISKPEMETTQHSKPKSNEFPIFNSNSKPVVVIEPLNEPTISKPEIETTQHSEPKSIEFTTFNSNSKPVVVIEPLNEPTISKPEIETTQHSEPKSIEFTTFNSNSKPVVVIEPLNEPTISKPEIVTTQHSKPKSVFVIAPLNELISKPEIETTQHSKPKSIEFTIFNSNSKPVVVIEPLNEPTISKPEIETTQHSEPKSIEFTTFNSNSKPVVVIEPLNEPTISKAEIETTQHSKPESIEFTTFNSNSKPVVVIEPLNEPTISKAEIEITQHSKPESIEFTTFNSNSKPVVVIVPLNLNRLETQLIIKGSKFYRNNLQNKSLDSIIKDNSITVDKLETPGVVQSNANSVSDILNDADNPLQKNCKGMEVDICVTPAIVEEKNNIDNKTDPEMAVSLEPKTSDVFKEPLVQKEETINKNTVTNVVIGEETYIFDRTLSQDYDQIDAGECDTVSDLPAASNNNEDEDRSAIKTASNGQEETLSPDSCQANNKTSDLKNLEDIDKSSFFKSTDGTISSKVDDLSTNDGCGFVLNKPTSDVNMLNVSEDVHRDCIFLDKGSIQNNSYTSIPIEDKRPTVASDVSSMMNDELNEVSNQVTEENNAKCVFLDQSLVIANAQSAESLEKKRKSPRLRLNRTRHLSLKLNKVVNDLPTVDNSHRKVNTDPEKCAQEEALNNSNDSETSITKHEGRSKEKIGSKKGLNDPEFIKYLEIRQDALLDDQPDLTQDEIVTYLYQNWLYEEGNKSDIKKIDDNEQSNLVKGFYLEPVPRPTKFKKKPKIKESLEFKNADIRDMMQKEKLKPVPEESKSQRNYVNKTFRNHVNKPNKHTLPDQDKTPRDILENNTQESQKIQTISVNKLNDIEDTKSHETCKTHTEDSNNFKENNVSLQSIACNDDIDILTEPKSDADSKVIKINKIEDPAQFENVTSPVMESNSLKENVSCDQINMDVEPDLSTTDTESVNLKELNGIENKESVEACTGKYEVSEEDGDKGSKEPALSKINGFIESEEVNSKTNDLFDPETASIKSEDSAVSATTRKGRKERQDVKKSTEDPEFLKYLEARQDALIDEQPDLTQEEIVTYLHQTWFYEESQKSDVMKTDETEQSNLVKGLNQEPAPQPRKYKKKPKVEKEPVGKVLKNADIRDMVQKPKRKATQSTPYYNEDDSDLEEEDLETFKIFDRDGQNEEGEEIDEVELYFEQLTIPKPNVFKGYARERVCEICDCASNLVKCKSCHGTFHVDCVKRAAEVIEVAAPTRGRKKKRGRKPKNYDPLLDSGSQSDERSQDANNSEGLNSSIEDEAESHIVIDADNFETQWENKLKEIQTENQDEYASDQEINWEVEPGHCEIVDLKHKEKPIDYSDYRCNNCLKHDTPVCFVCKSDKSPKGQIEVRQKCQVAHCHRYYHLECLDLWPQTQFHSWEPSKTNKKVIEYIEALSCPRHVCHTCVSDDPRGCKTRFCGDKLARCVKCPATYHSYTKCLPAGTQILTGSQIICPRHYENRPGKVPCHVNTGWCFICALGGTLICCEYCPTSFHAECLNIKPPEGSYMCEDCETGRLPLYGEMVWVKLGHYRWWPGIVLHPTEIPDNIMAVKHSPGEFVVRFFGQYDHYWVNRGRVFPFQEGDSGRISSQKSKIDAAFTTAMEHAQRACEILKKMQPNGEEDLEIASSLLPPHYVKLKVNKPVGGVARRDMDANSLTQCDCEPAQPDPCGPYSHCLNRMLLTECGPLCRAGDRCNNRAFERRLYPRLQAYRTPHRGWGLRTLDDIKQGQFVIEYVGELIDLEEFRRRMCRKHEIRDENFYFLTLDKERMIDAGPKGNLARFMNHCCEPNCETQKWTVLGDVRVGLFALRDIPPNSEVTFNYNLECAGIEKKRCLCGAQRCSGYIGAKPKQLQDDQPKKTKPTGKRTYKKRKRVEDPSKSKIPKIIIKPIKPRELTEIEKDLLIIKNATNGMSSDSEGSRVSVDDKNPKSLKRKRVSFSTDDVVAKKAKMADVE